MRDEIIVGSMEGLKLLINNLPEGVILSVRLDDGEEDEDAEEDAGSAKP